MKHLFLIVLIAISSCSKHVITLKPIDVYGSNEQNIPEPEIK
tara:strand:+ start:70 stop:195 length:126 start_codon:yes stop_codon:yes gene_type:complete